MRTIAHLLLIAAALAGVGCRSQAPPAATEPIRVGWQPPWANQGQVVEALKQSPAVTSGELRINLRPFTYGGPMTEAALAGELDVLFVGNQPAITLISRNQDFRIVSRLTNYRSAIVVPNESGLKTLADLRGKTIATAFGSTTHRDAVRRLQEAGLEPGKDVKLVNIDQAEHAAVIARGGTDKWGTADAIATYDPTIGVAVGSGQARVLTAWPSPAVVVAHRSLLEGGRRADLRRFLSAYRDAYVTYSKGPAQFDRQYEAESRLPLPPDTYRTMAAFEPNLSATDGSRVHLDFTGEEMTSLERDVDVALAMGIIKSRPDIRRFVDTSALP